MKSLAKKMVRLAGYEVRRRSPESMPLYHLWRALSHFGIDLVLDVGANRGQFAAQLRGAGFRGDIVSFEPLNDAHQLLAGAARLDSKWHVHARGAVGDHDGEITINVSGNSVSSSVLQMTSLHERAAEGSAYVTKENAPIYRLDSVAPQYLASAKCPFLKIDTQGFEWQVLDGARGILPRLRGVLCELSLAELYAEQRLWKAMIERLESEGFVLWSITRGFTDRRTGRTLQIDAAFFRQEP